MKAKELREMSSEQLELTLKDAVETLFRLKIQSQSDRTNAPSEIRRNRRTIARVKTLLRQRELAAASS